MLLVSNLLVQFAFSVFASHASLEEAPAPQASIIQRVEPGLLAVYDGAKITIKE